LPWYINNPNPFGFHCYLNSLLKCLPWYINNPIPQLCKVHLILNFNSFKMIEAIGLKLIEFPLKGTNCVPDFMKIYQAVQKLLVDDTQREC
jgi:hypothetical protein